MVVGDRTRKDIGILDDLADSMQAVGLLHPIILNSRHELIVGLRRLKAAEQLGWEYIGASVDPSLDELVKALRAEDDENSCRKPFTPREAVAMGKKVEAAMRPAAEAAQEASRPSKGQKIGTNKGGGKLSPPSKTGKLRKVAAAAAGMSEGTYRKAKEVVDAGEEDIAAEMDETGNVSAAHEKLKGRQAGPKPQADPLAEQARAYTAEIDSFVRRLDELLRDVKDLQGRSLGRSVHWHSVIDHLQAARQSASAGRPEYKCPHCKATGVAGGRKCDGCGAQGWIHKAAYRSGRAAVGLPGDSGADDE